MVSDTGSALIRKDAVDSPSSKNMEEDVRKYPPRYISEKPGVSGVGRSAKETAVRHPTARPQSTLKLKDISYSRQAMPSPQRMGLSIDTPSSGQATPHSCSIQNSEETSSSKQTTPSPKSLWKPKATPMRRLDRGKSNLPSNSLSSKKSKKDFHASRFRRTKKKALIQVTMESEKAELDMEPVSMKRKIMSARTFRRLFKKQRIQEPVPDVELEGRVKSSQICNGSSRGIDSNKGSSDKASDGCTDEGCNADVDDNMNSLIRDNVLDDPCPKESMTSMSVQETFDFSGRLSSNEIIDGKESGSSTFLARSRDGSVSSENHEWCYPEGPPPSPLPKCDNRNLIGTCVLCSKNRRVGYDSPEEDLCTCSPTENDDLCGFSFKDRNDDGADITLGSAEEFPMGEVNGDSQKSGQVCSLCYKEGELLCCTGRGCNRRYHLCCLDPSLTNAPPGVWHCSQCVKRKLLFGVHSVSKGVESIWDVREVEISNISGVPQKQYLVKYHGLAHIHNHWVPEKQLLLENPGLVAKFIEDNKNVRWNADWTVPHRLLRRKTIEDNIYIASSTVISVCNHEWLVKWCGLSYEDVTWELECTQFLSTPLGQKLMNDYETRRLKAHQEVNKHQKESIGKLLKLPAVPSHVNDNILKNVNKLRDCLSKCQNNVVYYDQEQVTTIILLIQSVSKICWPFLIVTASSSLSQWEADFAELVPSVDVVVYSGNKNTRVAIRSSEFYDEDRMILQVLLTSTEALLEDLDILRSIKWEAIVIDELHHPWSSNDLEQIKRLNTDSIILLSSCQTKETASEYLRILSLLEYQGDLDKLRGSKAETHDNLCKLRDRLSCFIPYKSTPQESKLLEYWVPVEISNHQLEQYCHILFDKQVQLCSCSPKDSVGAVREVVLAVRKCCDHPYLLDISSQERMIKALCPASEVLDIGIKASGKLQLLDIMLTEIKDRGLRVLILFQKLLMQSKGLSTGDILDDFLRQRFGINAYERVDNGLIPSKKQSAVNRFNLKESGQFAFLLENRACTSAIKLSSLDSIIIFDSDWNPANDLRALQKITIDSTVGHVKVFRLYSCYTVEEKALVFAKQNLNLNLDVLLQNSNRMTSDSLLSWGAIDLFRKLDEFHSNSTSTPDPTLSSRQLLLNEVMKDFRVLLSCSGDDTSSNTVISKAKLGVQGRVQSYTLDIPVFGESKAQVTIDGEEPYVFWRNLFYGKNPQWKLLSNPSQRIRKRAQYFEESMSNQEAEKVNIVKKRKKMVNNLHPTSGQAEQEVSKESQVDLANEGFSASEPCNKSQSLRKGLLSNDQNCTSGQRSSTELGSHHSFLHVQMTRLCESLQLAEDVTQAARTFLEYVIKNHHVNTNSPSIMHAFQISLCWIAASIRKQKVDKKESLMLAKQLLNYQCTEEQVYSVYIKMRDLKKMYLQSPQYAIDSYLLHSLVADNTNKEPFNVSQVTTHVSKHNMKIGESSGNEEHALSQKKLASTNDAASSEIDNELRKFQEKCDKRMKKLKQIHQKELEDFHWIWDEKKEKLEKDHELECAFIRSIHQGSLQLSDKLKDLNATFAKKIEEHNIMKIAELKILEAIQLAAVNEERQKADHWLAEAQDCPSELRDVNGSKSFSSLSEDVPGGLQHKDQDQSKSSHTVENDDAPPIITKNAAAEAVSTDKDQDQSKSSHTVENDDAPPIITKNAAAEAVTTGRDQDQSKSSHTVENDDAPPIITKNAAAEAVSTDKDQDQSKSSRTVNDDAPPIITMNAAAEAVSTETPGDNISVVDLQKELEAMLSSLDSPEHLNQPKHSCDNGENVSGSPSALGEKDSAESQPVYEELLTEQIHPPELNNTCENGGSRGSGIVLPDTLVSLGDELDKDSSDDLQNTEETLEHLVEAITTVPDSSKSLPVQVQLDTTGQSQTYADAPALQNQNTSHFEVTISEPTDTAIATQSNHEAIVNDELITTIPSNDAVPVTENTAELCSLSDAVLSSNESPVNEDHDHGRSSSLPAEPCRTQTVAHESTSGDREALEIPGFLDTGPMTDVGLGQSMELSQFPQDNIATPSIGVSSVEQTNQVIQAVGMNAGHGPGYLAPPTHQPYHSSQAHPLLEDPLQNELERMREETEQLEKNKENLISQLKLECEKEIEDIVAQINLKYDLKVKETAEEYRLKLVALDKNKNQVLMNKMLADAFKAKCLDLRTSGLPGVQQGVPLSFMNCVNQGQSPHAVRSFPVAPTSQPAASPQQMAAALVETMQPTPQPHPVLLSPGPAQTAANPPAQPVQRVCAPSQGTATPRTQPMQHVSPPSQSATSPAQPMQHVSAPSKGAAAAPVQPLQGISAPTPPVQPMLRISAPSQGAATPPVQPMQRISAPSQGAATPPVQPMQRISAPSQGAATPPVQPMQRTPIISGPPPRPLVISSFSPSVNPHVSGEIRAQAPHLQSQSRPRPPVPVPNIVSPEISQLQHQLMLWSLPAPPPPVPPLPNPPPLLVAAAAAAAAQPTVQLNAVSQDGLSAPSNQSTFTRDPEEETDYLLPTEDLDHVQGNQEPNLGTDHVVCLSDDE